MYINVPSELTLYLGIIRFIKKIEIVFTHTMLHCHGCTITQVHVVSNWPFAINSITSAIVPVTVYSNATCKLP